MTLNRSIRAARRATLRLARLYPHKLEPNKILLSNFNGGGYGCNPKYIAEEIRRRGLGWDLVWAVSATGDTAGLPPDIRTVPFGSARFLLEARTARTWISNVTVARWGLRKQPKQFYLQTGHGSFGIKRIGLRAANVHARRLTAINREARDLDFFLSHSAFETEVYRAAFAYGHKVLELGHARNDVLLAERPDLALKVRERYGLDPQTKVVLHVPSFRAGETLDSYDLDYDGLIGALAQRFGGDWVAMVRFHPRSRALANEVISSHGDRVINATGYEDVQELLAGADTAITDYSSCIFDFMLQRRPGFFYVTDLEQYQNSHGLYFPPEATPFPVATDNDELRRAVLDWSGEGYRAAVDDFLIRQGSVEDGQAAQRAVDLLEDLMA